MDQWLIRTHKNVIAGPYSKEQLCQLIRDGHLGLQDEICQANQYWISLYETDEVMRQLGVEVPRLESDTDEEITETSTQTLTEPMGVESVPVSEELPELEDAAEVLSEETAVLSNRALREFRPRPRPAVVAKQPGARGVQTETMARARTPIPRPGPKDPLELYKQSANPGLYTPVIVRSVERTSIWRGIAWAMILIAAFLTCAVIFLLRVT